MNDFLGNLIAKSTGNASAIRPYLPSRFEPVTPNEEQFEVSDEMDFERVTAPPPQVRSVVSVAAPRVERIAPPPLAEQRNAEAAPAETHQRNAEAVPSQPRYSTSEPEPAAKAPPALNPSRESEPALRVPDAVVRERLVERAAFVEQETRRPVGSPSEPLHIRVERVLPASTLLIAERPPAVTERDAETVYSVSPLEPPPPLAAAAVARERVKEQFPAARTEAGRRGAIPPRALTARRSSEPDIHVTIGRVEVRATPPPATPPARRNAPQPMSLEEYQRRRTSGEQR
jgi:hypothetical protein